MTLFFSLKIIRNNLLNKKKFVFPEFAYDDNLRIKISFPTGYIKLVYTTFMTMTRN